MDRNDLLTRMREGATLTWWFTSYALLDDETTVRVPTEVVEECLQANEIARVDNSGSPVTEYRLTERDRTP